MWMVWNPKTKDATIVADRAKAARLARERGWRLLPADSCTKCGGGKDSEGWCPNYCMDN